MQNLLRHKRSAMVNKVSSILYSVVLPVVQNQHIKSEPQQQKQKGTQTKAYKHNEYHYIILT